MISAPSDWQNLPVIALAAHLAEQYHDPRPANLQGLRRLFSAAMGKGTDRTDDTLSAIEDLLRSLETAFEAHLGTTATLISHVVALEEGIGQRKLAAPTTARLIQQLRVGHESVRALFDEILRLTTIHSLAGQDSDALRAVYAEVALLAQREGEHARLENKVLVARILSLDPALARDAVPVTLPVRTRELLSASGHQQVSSVFCPAEKRSFAPSRCRSCPLVRDVTESTVRCTPNAAEYPSNAGAARRLGENLSVGEAMGGHHVSVGPDVAAGAIARVMGDCRTPAAVVVDGNDRAVGVVERDRVDCARREQTASEIERESCGIVESASLAEAIARMVKKRERVLPVVGADGRVVGLLADLDALHLIATRRR